MRSREDAAMNREREIEAAKAQRLISEAIDIFWYIINDEIYQDEDPF